MVSTVGTISYVGTLVTDQLISGPWPIYWYSFPSHGAVPFRPQFALDILQPPNVDGARYRIGGAHFPTFTMNTICAAGSYGQASEIARDHETLKGDRIQIDLDGDYNTPRTCVVLNCRAVPNAKRIIGATSTIRLAKKLSGTSGIEYLPIGGPGGATEGDAYACVDTEWLLQVVPE